MNIWWIKLYIDDAKYVYPINAIWMEIVIFLNFYFEMKISSITTMVSLWIETQEQPAQFSRERRVLCAAEPDLLRLVHRRQSRS